MATTKKTEREFVLLGDFEKYSDDGLVEVQERLEAESDEVLNEVRAENKRRAELAIDAALERATRSGVNVTVPDQEPAKGKRGRKSKAQKAAEEVANGISEETFPSLLPD